MWNRSANSSRGSLAPRSSRRSFISCRSFPPCSIGTRWRRSRSPPSPCRCWRRSTPPGRRPRSIRWSSCAVAEAKAGEGAPLRLQGVKRHYAQGDDRLHILTGADLTLGAGEMVALVAPSGAGKSTLLHIAGLLERPDGGEVIVDGLVSAKLDDAARTQLRREAIGFVYQSHYLLGEFSAIENVMVPQMIRGLARSEARDRAAELLRLL